MALLSLSLFTTRRRRTAVRSLAVTPVVTADPAPEPETSVAPVRTNPYAGLEHALTIGEARLRFVRGLR